MNQANIQGYYDDDFLKAIGVGNNVEGAIPIGTKVFKTNSEKGDNYPDGTEAIVLGSQVVPEENRITPSGVKIFYTYCIKYPNSKMPEAVVFIVDHKIKL